MQGLSIPACLLNTLLGLILHNKKADREHSHQSVCAHNTHLHWQQVSEGQCHTHFIVATVFALSCGCVWRTGSPCAQTHTIGSLSDCIIVRVCGWVFVSVCDCRNLPASMILATPVRKRQSMTAEWDSQRDGRTWWYCDDMMGDLDLMLGFVSVSEKRLLLLRLIVWILKDKIHFTTFKKNNMTIDQAYSLMEEWVIVPLNQMTTVSNFEWFLFVYESQNTIIEFLKLWLHVAF